MTCEIISPPPLGDGAPARVSIAPTPPTLTLRALIDCVTSAVRTGVPREAWVETVVVSVRRRNSGYAVELGENDADHAAAGARLEAYLHERNLGAIREKLGISDFDPRDLEKSSVIVRLTLKFDPRFHLGGTIQDINPAIGASFLAKHLERIRASLRVDGLLDAQARLPTPADVRRLAVIHPFGAAAWADVASELERLQEASVLEVFDIAATFEGPSAIASLLAALQKVREKPSLDAVMLVRGGGASSGLAVLANEDLARAICKSPVPIITGIGHASDRGLPDEVAWRASDTPSKALRLVLDLIAKPASQARGNFALIARLAQTSISARRRSVCELLDAAAANSLKQFSEADAALEHQLSELRIRVATTRASLDYQVLELERLHRDLIAGAPQALNIQNAQTTAAIGKGALSAQSCLAGLAEVLRRPQQISGAVIDLLDGQSKALETLSEAFFAWSGRQLETDDARLADLEKSLRSLSIEDTLSRGFVLVTSENDGAIVSAAAEAKNLKNLVLHFNDGVVAIRL